MIAPVLHPAKLDTKNLSLPLLVFRIDANDPHHAAAVNDLALVTNLFHACPNFHAALLLVFRPDQPEGWLQNRPSNLATYSDTRCAHASNRKAKAPPLLCLPPESE